MFDITDLDDPEVMDVEDLLANDWITGGVAFSSGKATVIAVTSGNLAVDTAEYAMVTGKYRGASGSSTPGSSSCSLMTSRSTTRSLAALT